MSNPAPIVDNPDSLIIGAGADPISFGIAAPVDPNDDSLTITLTGVPADGVVEYWNGSAWTAASGGQSLTADELASLRYTPPASGEFSGESLTYTVSDGTTVVSGGVEVSAVAGAGGPDTLYFDATGPDSTAGDLYSFTADGGPVSDALRTDVSAADGSYAGEDGGFINFDGKLFFNAFTVDVGEALRAVGPGGATETITDGSSGVFAPTGEDSHFTVFDGSLYFRSYGPGGDELHSIDADGTTHDWDINPGAGNNAAPGHYGGFVVFDNALYFSAYSGGDNSHPGSADLMRLDTDGSLHSLAIRTGPNAAYGSFAGEDGGYVIFNNALYFNAYSDSAGETLFKLDAGSDTAVAVDSADIDHADATGIDSGFHVFNDKLYFNDFSAGAGGETLFQLDASGTVTTLQYGGENLVNAGALGGFVDMGGATYFVASTSGTGMDLFKLDTSGTVTALDLNPGAADLADNDLRAPMVVFNGALYIDGYDASFGDSLYKVDPDGTVSTVFTGDGSRTYAGVSGFQVMDEVLYFRAFTVHGIELVAVDQNGDFTVHDINLSGSSDPGDPGGFGVLPGIDFTGTGGNDILAAGLVGASLDGAAGDDLLRGGSGDDTLNGGDGTDTVTYENAQAGVTVDLSSGSPQATGGGGTDTLADVENLTGSAFADTLTGDVGANLLTGGSGDDTLEGGGGNDTLAGGAGVDTASFAHAGAAVSVSLAVPGAQLLGAGSVTLSGIENLLGSNGADSLGGDAGDNLISGGSGNDTLRGGGSGHDTLDGGFGADTAAFDDAAAGVRISLAAAGAQTVGSGDVTLAGIENLTGSAFGDALTGDADNNFLFGGADNDTLAGGGGHDTLDGGSGIDTASFAAAASGVVISVAVAGPQQVDAGYVVLSQIENLTGSAFDDSLIGGTDDNTLSGGSGDDTLTGGGGHDVLNGGAGVDTASFAGVSEAVTLNLGDPSPQLVDGGSVAFVDIENLTGSDFDDRLTGTSGPNLLAGAGGDDWLQGGGGDDTLVGGRGHDTASFADASGAETIDLGAGIATGSDGSDTLVNVENVMGSEFDDQISGDHRANDLEGGGGADLLTGDGAGADTLAGGEGDDTIVGGRGDDVLTGGGGADVFRFVSLKGLAGHDVITDLENQDVIDLSAIDTRPHDAGHQGFTLVAAFDGHKGELMLSYDAGQDATSFLFDLNGDGAADASLQADGDHRGFTSFVL